jgi:hypothetical protein
LCPNPNRREVRPLEFALLAAIEDAASHPIDNVESRTPIRRQLLLKVSNASKAETCSFECHVIKEKLHRQTFIGRYFASDERMKAI